MQKTGLALLAISMLLAHPAWAAEQSLDDMQKQLSAAVRSGNEKARKAVESLIQEGLQDPSKYAMVGIGALIYLDAGEYALAAQTYEKAIDLEPKKAFYYADMAIAYNALGRREKAIDAARRSVELEPADPLNRLNLGRYLAEKGDLTEGRNAVQQALKLAQDQRDAANATKAQTLLNLLDYFEHATQRDIKKVKDDMLAQIAAAKARNNQEAVDQGLDSMRLIEAFDKSSSSPKAQAKAAEKSVPAKHETAKKAADTSANAPAADLIKLKNGNEVEGTITRQNGREVVINIPEAGEVAFARDEIASIAHTAQAAQKMVPASPARKSALPNLPLLIQTVEAQPPPANKNEPIVMFEREQEGVTIGYVVPLTVALAAAQKMEEANQAEQAIDIYRAILKVSPDNATAQNRLKQISPNSGRSG